MNTKPLILIVDDQKEDRASLSAILEAEGYPYVEASSAREAVEKAKDNKISLVLLDLGLPDLNGRLIISKLLETRPDLGVIVVSSTLDMEERLQCFSFGAEDFITKPYHERETLARIKRSLGEYDPHGARQIKCGPLVLDANTRQVLYGDAKIEIGGKVFDIFYLMAANPGKVYSKEKIRQLVWKGSHVSDNSLWVHMNKLNKMLSSVEGAGKIENHRGTGYCYTSG